MHRIRLFIYLLLSLMLTGTVAAQEQAQVYTFDLRQTLIQGHLAGNSLGDAQDFSSWSSHFPAQATVVNGIYFGESNRRVVGNLILNGELINQAPSHSLGTTFWLSAAGEAHIERGFSLRPGYQVQVHPQAPVQPVSGLTGLNTPLSQTGVPELKLFTSHAHDGFVIPASGAAARIIKHRVVEIFSGPSLWLRSHTDESLLVGTGQYRTQVEKLKPGNLVHLVEVGAKHQAKQAPRLALGAGPMLLDGGQVSVEPETEGFHDPDIFHPARRVLLGLKDPWHAVLAVITEPLSLHEAAELMRRQGCQVAMALDGGSSLALAQKGQILHQPSRRLTNLISFTPKHTP